MDSGEYTMPNAQSGLKLSHYQAQPLRADKSPDKGLAFPLLGLFGETGSLLSVVKKKQRDKAAYLGYAPHVVEELGDVLWYLAVVAHRGGITLADVANNVQSQLAGWKNSGAHRLTFRAIQTS